MRRRGWNKVIKRSLVWRSAESRFQGDSEELNHCEKKEGGLEYYQAHIRNQTPGGTVGVHVISLAYTWWRMKWSKRQKRAIRINWRSINPIESNRQTHRATQTPFPCLTPINVNSNNCAPPPQKKKNSLQRVSIIIYNIKNLNVISFSCRGLTN